MTKPIIFDLTSTQPIGNTMFHGGGKYGENIYLALIGKVKNVVGWYDSKRYLNPEIINKSREREIELIDANDTDIVDLCKDRNGIIYFPMRNMKIIERLPECYTCVATIHGERVLELLTDSYEYKYELGLSRRLKYKYLNKLVAVKRRIESLQKVRSFFERKNVRFVAVSEHTKASLLSFVPKLRANDIKVCYSPLKINTDVSGDSIVEGKYYLLVSGNRWLKNAYRAMMAFDSIFDEHPDFIGKVVITGMMSDSPIIKEMKHKDRYVCLGYVTDHELEVLYRDAHLFVYPSLNEGFGYPPLEAMSRETPVIASAIASIPEVCGDAVMYFNPYSVDEIKMRILQMEDPFVRCEYICRGSKRYQYISSRQERDMALMIDMLVNYAICECPISIDIDSYENNDSSELPARGGRRTSSYPMVWSLCRIGA